MKRLFLPAIVLYEILLMTGCGTDQSVVDASWPTPGEDSSAVSSSTPAAQDSPDADFTIEIEDATGDNFTLTKSDLYYRFFLNLSKSAVLVNGWDNPSEIEASYLTNFFVAQSNWNQVANDAVEVLLPQEYLEGYLQMYFNVEPAHLRTSMDYKEDLQAYDLPLYPLETAPWNLIKATAQGNRLILYYDIFNGFVEGWPLLYQGYVTIEVERYPYLFKYISNVQTFDFYKDAESK